MVNLGSLRNGVGFGFKTFGFFWGLFDRVLCDWLCVGNICTENRIASCSFLFLFVAIIFVVCGYAIIKLPKRKKAKIKKIVKSDIK